MIEDFIIQKPKALIYISNDLTKRERLVLNFLILVARSQIKEKNIKCEFMLADIKNVYNIRHFKVIRDILKSFNSNMLNIDLLKEEKQIKVIEDLTINTSRVEVLFSEDFFNLLKINSYVKIDLKQQTKLNSKYSILLYEMINDYYRESNHFMQIPHIKLNVFKNLMGFEDITNYQLKTTVLNTIIKDIENETNFYLQYEFLKKGGSKKYNYIEFKFSKLKMKPKKSNEEILKEIERQREKLQEESEQLTKKRWEIWEDKNELEETIERYEKVLKEFDNKCWEVS